MPDTQPDLLAFVIGAGAGILITIVLLIATAGLCAPHIPEVRRGK